MDQKQYYKESTMQTR